MFIISLQLFPPLFHQQFSTATHFIFFNSLILVFSIIVYSRSLETWFNSLIMTLHGFGILEFFFCENLQQHGGFITLLWSEEEITEITTFPHRVQTVTTSTKFQINHKSNLNGVWCGVWLWKWWQLTWFIFTTINSVIQDFIVYFVLDLMYRWFQSTIRVTSLKD